MTYVDGFVVPAPRRQTAAYMKMAKWGKQTWMKHGALQYFECLADDLKTMPGCGDFKKLVKLQPGETPWYSFIVYKNKTHRNAVTKKVMKEMETYKMPMREYGSTVPRQEAHYSRSCRQSLQGRE